jgi:protein involved in polysaccharide export with SLBB domain
MDDRARQPGESSAFRQAARPGQNRLTTAAWQTLRLAILVLAGCTTSSSGSGSSLFSDQHRLLPSTLAVRQPDVALDMPRELAKEALPNYVVEGGDVLLVTPVEPEIATGEDTEPDKNPTSPVRIPADQPVLPDGSINLGRYGRLIVAGNTVEQIEAAIRATIHAQIKRDPGFITVRIVTRDSKVYYVLGEVNSPGTFQLKGRETVLDAILTAGGLKDTASRDNIILSRPTGPCSCRVVIPICYREITQLGDTATNYQIMPGDRVYVPQKRWYEYLPWCCEKCPRCRHAHYPCEIPFYAPPALPPAPPHGPPEPIHSLPTFTRPPPAVNTSLPETGPTEWASNHSH